MVLRSLAASSMLWQKPVCQERRNIDNVLSKQNMTESIYYLTDSAGNIKDNIFLQQVIFKEK